VAGFAVPAGWATCGVEGFSGAPGVAGFDPAPMTLTSDI